MELLSGFIIGILGSLHCLGMCGPIALSVPHRGTVKLSLTIDNILYNGGRILTYTFLGGLIGLIGFTAGLAGYQEKISVFAGIILLLAVIVPGKYYKSVAVSRYFLPITDGLRNLLGKLFDKPTKISIFLIGILNGFLPCGLVYVALTASFIASNPVNSAVFMLFFGLGTFPSMSFIYSIRKVLSIELRRKIKKFIPFGVALIAVLMIIRGLSLGIPYISPDLEKKYGKTNEKCH